MIPIQDLLARIRWDPALRGSRFELGYLDHVRNRIVRVPLSDVEAEPDDRFALSIADEDGVVRSIQARSYSRSAAAGPEARVRAERSDSTASSSSTSRHAW